MPSALLIGCGNIGARYDLNQQDRVLTYARAFSKKKIRFAVTDADVSSARQISKHYKVPFLEADLIDYSAFDIVAVATPTHTHIDYLRALLNHPPRVIICEKPVANNLQQLNQLKRAYQRGNTPVLVNYIRRFQPGFAILKKRLHQYLAKDVLETIHIRYQRGLLNNASHAFDLLEFLFDSDFLFEESSVLSYEADAFADDPTVTGSCTFHNIPVFFTGIPQAGYVVFELEFWFRDHRILVTNSGNDIRYFNASKKRVLEEEKKWHQKNLLNTYMIPVVQQAMNLIGAKKRDDNFLSSLHLNQRIISLQKKYNLR